ncbi:MAG: iron-containing alcohol dehydrogenase, partial [Spirochaetales bacterium]|nr:iron-containing alcohol dehydrogenase [Spirochaetales bacterium]
HVPHGLANAVVLPHILDACRESCDKRLAALAEDAGISLEGSNTREQAEKLVGKIRELNRKFGIPETIKELKKEDIPLLAERASREAFYLYAPPAYYSPAEMEGILKKMLPEE